MADQNELFRTLDDGNENGLAPRSKAEGDAPSTDLGSMGFAFKDSSGNLVLPQLDADGKLPVAQEAAGTDISASATVTPADTNDTDVVTIALTASTDYVLKFFSGASTKTVLWTVEQTDDATTTDLHKFITGAGQFTHSDVPPCITFSAGASGTQQIKLIGNQISGGQLSDMHGTLCLLEKA